MIATELTLEQRRAARIAADARSNMPVRVISGAKAPEVTGTSWCFRTKGGSKIRYPSAYSKFGWSNMVYCPSTLCVEVGEDYLPQLENVTHVPS